MRSSPREGDTNRTSGAPTVARSESGDAQSDLYEAQVHADECARALLIAELAGLIREPAMPEWARLAGLTLIGWLARRRPEEPPHAIGVNEARKSERRLLAVRPKVR